MYWTIVELVYIIDVIIFGFLAFYFWGKRKESSGDARIVITTMALLTTFLFLQELYFGINTATDPAKVGLLPSDWFAAISQFWIYAKVILTIGGIAIIYMLKKISK